MDGFSVVVFVVTIAFVGVVVTGALALWIWSLVDAARNEPTPFDKWLWVLVILCGHGMGWLVYVFYRRPQRMQQLPQ